jgi:hypothetical protein
VLQFGSDRFVFAPSSPSPRRKLSGLGACSRGACHQGNSVSFFSHPQRSTRLRCYVIVPDGGLRGSAGARSVESMAAFKSCLLTYRFCVGTRVPCLLRLDGRLDRRLLVRSIRKKSELLRFAIAFLLQHELPLEREFTSALLHSNDKRKCVQRFLENPSSAGPAVRTKRNLRRLRRRNAKEPFDAPDADHFS